MSAKFRVPAYCVHTARNQAYVRLNGEMIYLGPPGSPESKERYNRLIAEWLAAGRMYVVPEQRATISVNEVLLAYRRYAETYYVNPDGTHTAELERVNFAIAPGMELYGTTAAESFGPKALKAVRDKMIADGLCRLTINQRIGCVKRAFGWTPSGQRLATAPSRSRPSTPSSTRNWQRPRRRRWDERPPHPAALEAAVSLSATGL